MERIPEPQGGLVGVFDRSAETYEQVGPEFFAPIGAELARRAALAPGERLLDVGCGRGHVLLPAALAGRGAACGVDLAPGMVAALAADARAQGLQNVDVRVGDAAAPDFPAGSFDVVTAGLVIFFLPDPATALGIWAALLRPGGRLALSTFSHEDRIFAAVVKTVIGFAENPPERRADNQLYKSHESVNALVAANGFTEVRSEEVVFETRFTDRGQWWRWLWSHGCRLFLERVPADRMDDCRAAAYEAMAPAETPDGGLAIHSGLRFTTAVTAGGS